MGMVQPSMSPIRLRSPGCNENDDLDACSSPCADPEPILCGCISDNGWPFEGAMVCSCLLDPFGLKSHHCWPIPLRSCPTETLCVCFSFSFFPKENYSSSCCTPLPSAASHLKRAHPGTCRRQWLVLGEGVTRI